MRGKYLQHTRVRVVIPVLRILRLTSPPYAAEREHSESCGAAVDLDNFRVLSASSYELDLRILESLLFLKLNQTSTIN